MAEDIIVLEPGDERAQKIGKAYGRIRKQAEYKRRGLMAYQDTWMHGQVLKKGYRECASRYAIVHDFCAHFDGSFPVLDIGANQCYFGLRLTEDFSQCSVLAFEYSDFEARARHVRLADKTQRLLLCKRKLSLHDVQFMSAFARFDLILTLSLLHHVGGEFDGWLKALRALGKNIIAEFAVTDSRARRHPNGYRLPDDAFQLGVGDSHIAIGEHRPIVLIKGKK